MALTFLVFVLAPVVTVNAVGCVTTKNATLFFTWHCEGYAFLILTGSVVIGSSLILFINSRSKTHSILWYVMAGWPLFAVAGYYGLLLLLSQTHFPAF